MGKLGQQRISREAIENFEADNMAARIDYSSNVMQVGSGA
jgi:hypothetical protein